MKKYPFALFTHAIFTIVLILAAPAGYGNDISYTYDQLNRLIKVQYSDGTTVQYSYDEIGNRVTQNVSKSSDLRAIFEASPTSGPAPLSVAFTDKSTGTISSWSWDFGDGESSTGQNPVHNFSSAGTFTVTLTISNGSKLSSQSADLTVNEGGPRANFSANPTSGISPLAVQFTDSSTGSVTDWSWSFGDGGISTDQNPAHTYASPGTYSASLTVTGPGGTSGPVSTIITVSPKPPAADFYATPESGTAPLTVSFTNHSTGIITAWSWTFGDGATSSSENPNHTYSSPGTYTASLTAGGPNGYSSTKSVSINVKPVVAPKADFTATPTSGTAPLDVSFADNSTGTITSWSWSFGDGKTSTDRNPTHTYTKSGTYSASLTVTGPGGRESSKSIAIATSPAAADFKGSPVSGYNPLKVQFSNMSTGSPEQWLWNFGDGSTNTSQYPLIHTYSMPGTYTVSLTITDPDGAHTKTRANYINVKRNYGLDQYTKLLLHLDGANDSTTFVDSENIPKKIAGYGSARITTASGKFGGASLKLNNDGSYLTVPPSPDWNLSGDFTIDFWWMSQRNVGGPIIGMVGGAYSFMIYDHEGTVRLFLSSDGKKWDIAEGVSIGPSSYKQFDHFAVVRSENTYYAFCNGILARTISSSLSPRFDASNALNIGKSPSDFFTTSFAGGYLDEVRVSKGIARWTANFTPPGSAYNAGPLAPKAEFTSNATVGCAPLPIQFTDTSTGSCKSWSWHFGDGATSTKQYPSHTYSSPGTYTVSLSVKGPKGSNTKTKTGYIKVNKAPPGRDKYTKLLLHLNGANGSTTFVDSEIIPKRITGYGSAQITTASSKFGGASLKLKGDGSYLSVPPSPDWDLSGDFTIDFWWMRQYQVGGPIMAMVGGAYSFMFSDGYGSVCLSLSSDGKKWDIAHGDPIGPSDSKQFNHFALVRSGSTYYAFCNGVLTRVISSSLSPHFDASNALNIGKAPVGSYGYTAAGYLDEVRVSKGIARWTANFTPPGSAYASTWTNRSTRIAGTGRSGSLSAIHAADHSGSHRLAHWTSRLNHKAR